MKLSLMQGRLTPTSDERIQFFPIDNWKNELPLYQKLGLNYIEWTIDHHLFYQNPIIDKNLHEDLKRNIHKYGLSINAVTCDFLMQKPLIKKSGEIELETMKMFQTLIENCNILKINKIVFPLVDQSSLKTNSHLIESYINNLNNLDINLGNLKILFELDLIPDDSFYFISNFSKQNFGINYDMGNSASYGYQPEYEINKLIKYIYNVHIKDRKLNSETTELGKGHVDFVKVFNILKFNGYDEFYTVQGARIKNISEFETIKKYIKFIYEKYSN